LLYAGHTLKKKILYVAPFLLLIGIFALVAKNKITNSFSYNCRPSSFSGAFTKESLASFDGKSLEVSDLAISDFDTDVLGDSTQERWISVDLSEQKLTAWEGNSVFLETKISSGLPWWPTPKGEFRIWIKLRATKMEGGEGRYYYNLPNVPFVMFFSNEYVPSYLGYGLHGTYWHNNFGTPRSHGCVNLPTDVAQVLFYWTNPQIPEGKSVVKASDNNPGTRIVIHE